MQKQKYSVGEVVGDLKLVSSESSVNGHTRYLTECQVCTRQKIMLVQNLTKRHGTTHKACSQGYRKQYPKLYSAWCKSIDRVTNPKNSRYRDYGGRGLTHGFPLFIDFVDYMLPKYLEKVSEYSSYDITLERLDNDLGYVKGNLTWATQREQAMNKRTTVTFKAYAPDGAVYLSKNAQMFAEQFGLDRSSISKVITGKRPSCNGWRFEKSSEMCVEAIERVSN